MILLLPAASATTLEVGSTKTYKTIGDALAASTAGDTVKVYDGTYAESLDLRGHDVTVISAYGPSKTFIATTSLISLDSGVLEGFSIDPSPSTALSLTGTATVRNLYINAPASYGVYVSSGSALVQEVVVVGAGINAFQAASGATPTFLRSVAVSPGTAGFAIQGRSTVRNAIVLGGSIAFKTEGDAAAVFDHVLGVAQSAYAVSALVDGTFSNSIFDEVLYLAKCKDTVATFPNGISSPTTATTGCDTSTGSLMVTTDPALVRYSASLDLRSMDLSLSAASPARDAANDTDADGSVGDLGPFGGPYGVWTDQDGDDVPDVFDCADHDGNTYAYASEIGDGVDNDCDGTIDEGVPIDTGDTGDTGETGDSGETGETADTSDSADTEVVDPGPVDLDGDGYDSTLDCDEHNLRSHPGALEVPDFADNDCNGRVDDGTGFGDYDNDGWTLGGGDCNDTDPTIHPGAEEPPSSNGLDEDCDGVDDFGRTSEDADNDGFSEKTECNDLDAAIHPSVYDGGDLVDNDCDGMADEDALGADADGDGTTVGNGDCDDHDAGFSPSSVDTPDDFLDQDCTGTDNYDVDRDGDPAPVSGGTDCDDSRSNIRPGLAEICSDGIDNNCDDVVDEGCDQLADTASKLDEGDCGCASAPHPGLASLLAFGLWCRRRRTIRTPTS